MTLHRAHSPRGNKRLAAVLSAFFAISLVTAGMAVADTLAPDGDTLSVSPQLAYKLTDTPQSRLCSTRGTAVPGTLTIAYGGGQHLSAGEAIDVDFTAAAGITIAVDAADLTMPATWDENSPAKVIDFTTTVSAAQADGSYPINFNATGVTSDKETSGGSEQFHVNVACTADVDPEPVNVAPSVTVTAPDSVDEGSDAVVGFTITDPDSSSFSFVSGSPTCGTDATGHPGVVSLASIATASFTCTYVDGVDPAQAATVSVQVTDGTDASNVATDTIGVDNVAPSVAAPAFTSAAVDCRSVATLGGISFADAGTDDDDWAVSIDWGDGSTDTAVTASAQGTVADQTHTYVAPGNYVATVTVTDKDLADGSNVTATGITVNQAYTTDFLPPFDDSDPSKLITNTMKNGRVVPVKVTIFDVCANAPLTDPTKVVTIKTAKTGSGGDVDTVESYADAGSSSAGTNRFRANDSFWIYNLDSTYLGLVVNTTYRIDVYVDGVQATKKSWALLKPVK